MQAIYIYISYLKILTMNCSLSNRMQNKFQQLFCRELFTQTSGGDFSELFFTLNSFDSLHDFIKTSRCRIRRI